MPRLPSRLLLRAAKLSPLLPLLLPACRTLSSARAELRWLRSHVEETIPIPNHSLRELCLQRGRLRKPLQYLLGTQPFGALDILCRPGVLIPRPETEEFTLHLAGLLKKQFKGRVPRVLDLCTGTGCIALLLAAETMCEVVGVDLSPSAVACAEANLRAAKPLLHAGSTVEFAGGDVFDDLFIGDVAALKGGFDVVVSNPPYISASGYERECEISVRRWEPRLALVAEEGGDAFYERIAEVAEMCDAGVVVVETGAKGQEGRVQVGWGRRGWETGIWRDYRGRGRCVVAWKGVEGEKVWGEGPVVYAGNED